MIKDLALTLLADSVASIVENSSEEIRELFLRPQEDIVECLKATAEDLGIDLEPYLPIELTKEIIASYEQAWDCNLKFEDLYEQDSQSAHRAILGSLGHGVQINDEDSTEEWLISQGVKKMKSQRLFEGPFELAMDFVAEVERVS